MFSRAPRQPGTGQWSQGPSPRPCCPSMAEWGSAAVVLLEEGPASLKLGCPREPPIYWQPAASFLGQEWMQKGSPCHLPTPPSLSSHVFLQITFWVSKQGNLESLLCGSCRRGSLSLSTHSHCPRIPSTPGFEAALRMGDPSQPQILHSLPDSRLKNWLP